jgi:hypothetical protein
MLQLPNGAKALINVTPFGLPQPVTRSYPFSVEYVPLLPLVMSWKSAAWLEPKPIP